VRWPRAASVYELSHVIGKVDGIALVEQRDLSGTHARTPERRYVYGDQVLWLVRVQVHGGRKNLVEISIEQEEAPLLPDYVERQVELVKTAMETTSGINVGDVEKEKTVAVLRKECLCLDRLVVGAVDP
jgi:hypothetical protein